MSSELQTKLNSPVKPVAYCKASYYSKVVQFIMCLPVFEALDKVADDLILLRFIHIVCDVKWTEVEYSTIKIRHKTAQREKNKKQKKQLPYTILHGVRW